MFTRGYRDLRSLRRCFSTLSRSHLPKPLPSVLSQAGGTAHEQLEPAEGSAFREILQLRLLGRTVRFIAKLGSTYCNSLLSLYTSHLGFYDTYILVGGLEHFFHNIWDNPSH